MNFEVENKDGNIEVRLINGTQKAKATCFFENTLEYEGKKVGTIGNFETDNYILGVMILKKCEELLKGKGCNLIVAPMNGNTWKKYRTLSYTNGDPSFLLENVNPIEHNEILKEAGFEKMYTYTSTKGKIEDYVESPVLDILEKRMKEKKITIRNFDKNKYIEDLKKIYNVALPSFYKNPFYTPISEDDFLAQYIPYISMFDEELILIAEQDGKTVGFLFSLPDIDKESIVVKTCAVLKEYQKLALGSILLSKLQDRAKLKGFKNWIFAFMYQNNTSQKSAKRHKTELIREYALYVKEI